MLFYLNTNINSPKRPKNTSLIIAALRPLTVISLIHYRKNLNVDSVLVYSLVIKLVKEKVRPKIGARANEDIKLVISLEVIVS